LAQILGGLAAAFLLGFAVPGDAEKALVGGTPALATGVPMTGGIIFEAIATFFLIFVIFSTSMEKRPGRVATLFIGLAVTIDILAIGPYTGAAMNPARYLGPAIASGRVSEAWIFFVGPLLGALAVALMFMTPSFQPEDEEEEEAIVTVEHVPSDAEMHHRTAPAPAERIVAEPVTPEPAPEPAPVAAEPVISPDPPRYLSYMEAQPAPPAPTQTAPTLTGQAVAPSFTEPGLAADGRLNFTSIYKLANLPEVPFTAEQVLEMLNALPGDLPLESRRAALAVTLKTLGRTNGASEDSVLADATRKVQALATFAESYTDQANQYILRTQHDVEMMESEIEKRQRGIDEATNRQTHMVEACQAEADRIERLFAFFDAPQSA
jgi:hypothetical protein